MNSNEEHLYGSGGVREKRPGQWQVYFSVDGKKQFRAGGSTREEALKALQKYQRQTAKGDYKTKAQERITVGKLLDLYALHLDLKGARSNSTPSQITKLKRVFGLDRALAQSTAQHIERWVAEQRALPPAVKLTRAEQQKAYKKRRKAKTTLDKTDTRPADATLNRHLQALRAAYRYAAKKKLFPLGDVPHFELLKEDNVRQGFFEAAEWSAVRVELPEPIADFCHFGYLTGWRRGAVRNLEWSRVDLEAKELRIERVVGGKPRCDLLPLEGEIGDLIEKRAAYRSFVDEKTDTTSISKYVFHVNGRAIGDFRGVWTAACKKAGVSGKLPFHDFRRTAARDMIRAGVSEHVAMAITGHKTESMFRRYDITSTDDKRHALDLRSRYLAEQAKKTRKVIALK